MLVSVAGTAAASPRVVLVTGDGLPVRPLVMLDCDLRPSAVAEHQRRKDVVEDLLGSHPEHASTFTDLQPAGPVAIVALDDSFTSEHDAVTVIPAQALRGKSLEIVPEAEQAISYRVPASAFGARFVAGFAASRIT